MRNKPTKEYELFSIPMSDGHLTFCSRTFLHNDLPVDGNRGYVQKMGILHHTMSDFGVAEQIVVKLTSEETFGDRNEVPAHVNDILNCLYI